MRNSIFPSPRKKKKKKTAIFMAFYSPNVVHAVFSFETRSAARKSQPFNRFWRRLSVISLLLEIFRRSNGILVRFYAINATHACFAVETSTATRKSQTFTPFWRKLTVISLLLEMFRLLNAIFISFYALNVVHAIFSFETSTVGGNFQPFNRFWRKLCVISLLLETFDV